MKPVLAVLHVRRIPQVLLALEALPIDKALITGYTERQIADHVWTEQVLPQARERGYTHLTLISDDAVIPPHSLQAVLQHAEQHPDRVTTGWCNQDFTDDRVALSTTPLLDDVPTLESYTLPTWRDVLTGPAIQTTYFTGFCLTTCTLETWEQYPYQAYGAEGYAADYNMSQRLHRDGIRIDAVRDAFCLHLRQNRGGSPDHPERRVLIGEMKPDVTWV